MGLDSIELLMEVENAFGIRIPDAEAEKIYTVGNFHDAVWTRIVQRDQGKCISQMLFYKLRRELCIRYDHRKSEIGPETIPDTLLPLQDRKAEYKRVSHALGLELPELVLKEPVNSMFMWFAMISIGGSLVVSFIVTFFWNWSGWWWIVPVVSVLVVYLLSAILEPFRTQVPHESMREFVQKTMIINRLVAETAIARKEMEAIVNQIIVDKIGLDMAELSPEKSLTDDLGIS